MSVAEEIYARLFAHFGPQHWWPAESSFEVMVGAVLVQNTAWKNAARAIESLRTAGLLDPWQLHALSEESLAEQIRSCGYFRIKAKRLKNLIALLVEQFDGDVLRLSALPTADLRALLLTVNGIGPETADCIVLYAAGQPRFVVDKYTWRVLVRHGWIDPRAKYHDMQTWFEQQLPADVVLFNEFHALLVRLGHEHCRATPRCEGCPLAPLLPPGGIVPSGEVK